LHQFKKGIWRVSGGGKLTTKILLVKGGLDGHDRGIQIVTKALRDSGFDVIYGGLYCSPEEIAAITIQENVDVVGISTHSGNHLGIFSETIKILKEKTNTHWPIIGGGIIPANDIPALEKMGVDKIYLPSTNITEIVEFIKGLKLMKRKKESQQKTIERILKGEVFAAASLMSLVEQGDNNAKKIISKLPDLSPQTIVVGITGFGGVGKSTLINKLIEHFRKDRKTVGVIACDPVSVSRGAVMGDRIRMKDHAQDEGVFIRSIVQRQNFKGVTPTTPSIIKILGAMKKDIIIVETAGAGQENSGFKDLVKVLVWVSVPGLGDKIQMLKGGGIETANIIVVNQSDKAASYLTFQDLKEHFENTKKICKTNSLTGEGISELVKAIKVV